MWCKGLTAMLSNHSDTVNGCLSDGAELGIGIGANLENNLRIDSSEELGAQELNHIIQNEKDEFHAVLVL